MPKVLSGAAMAAAATRVIAEIDDCRAAAMKSMVDYQMQTRKGWWIFKRYVYPNSQYGRAAAEFDVDRMHGAIVHEHRRDARNMCFEVIRVWENRTLPSVHAYVVLPDRYWNELSTVYDGEITDWPRPAEAPYVPYTQETWNNANLSAPQPGITHLSIDDITPRNMQTIGRIERAAKFDRGLRAPKHTPLIGEHKRMLNLGDDA